MAAEVYLFLITAPIITALCVNLIQKVVRRTIEDIQTAMEDQTRLVENMVNDVKETLRMTRMMASAAVPGEDRQERETRERAYRFRYGHLCRCPVSRI